MSKLLLLGCVFAASLAAQPRIGSIEIFGARQVSKDKILKALAVKPGDPLPPSKGAAEERVEDVEGVLKARLEIFCCDEGKTILYVGIEERGGIAFQPRPEPAQELSLPAEVTGVYETFSSALGRAAQQQDLDEDLTEGHSLMRNPEVRTLQRRMIGLAATHEAELQNVLKNAADPAQRSIAAYVLQYVPDKSTVVNDLQLGMQDPDDSVRANAARSLRAIAVLGERDPELKIRVQATWFVELLNSVALQDRLEAAKTLLSFTDRKNEFLITNIRDRALPSLNEMARWQHLPHALPGFLLLGRVSGRTDIETMEAFANDRRETFLESIRKQKK